MHHLISAATFLCVQTNQSGRQQRTLKNEAFPGLCFRGLSFSSPSRSLPFSLILKITDDSCYIHQLIVLFQLKGIFNFFSTVKLFCQTYASVCVSRVDTSLCVQTVALNITPPIPRSLHTHTISLLRGTLKSPPQLTDPDTYLVTLRPSDSLKDKEKHTHTKAQLDSVIVCKSPGPAR